MHARSSCILIAIKLRWPESSESHALGSQKREFKKTGLLQSFSLL